MGKTIDLLTSYGRGCRQYSVPLWLQGQIVSDLHDFNAGHDSWIVPSYLLSSHIDVWFHFYQALEILFPNSHITTSNV